MIPFNYHHLYYFHTIARCGTITKACEELRLAQPTLSAQLKAFENYLGVKLFDRDGRKLVLTDQGRYVLSYANEIFDTGKEFMDGLSDLSHRSGRMGIQIGASSLIPRSFLDSLVSLVFRLEPRAHVVVTENDMPKSLEALHAHQLDLVLTDAPYESIQDSKIESYLAGKIPIVFCAHPKLAAKIKRFPQDLDGFPMILPTSHSRVYRSVQEYFLAKRLKPQIIAEIQDVEIVRRMALDGLGAAALNLYTVRHAPGRSNLDVLGGAQKIGIEESIYLLVKKRKKHHPLIPKLIERFRIKV